MRFNFKADMRILIKLDNTSIVVKNRNTPRFIYILSRFDDRRFKQVFDLFVLGLSIIFISIVNDAAKSDVPALGYAGTYTFANVILTSAGTFIMTL